jgi:hypothetical protein
MTRRGRQLHLAGAERNLADAHASLHASMARLRARLDRHGPFALLGAGAATGAVAGLLPLGGVARMMRGLTSIGLLLLRVPANAWIGVLRMHDRSNPQDPAP